MAPAPDLVRRHTVFTTKLAASIQKTAILGASTRGQYQAGSPLLRRIPLQTADSTEECIFYYNFDQWR